MAADHHTLRIWAFMAIEYDLVIFGATPEGVSAADRAIQLGARVALICQGADGRRSPLLHQGLLDSLQLAAIQPPNETVSSPWQWLQQRSTLIADTLSDPDLPGLMVRGCDVISEMGQVVSDRPLTITTATRRLTTRAIVLATGCQPKVPAISGFATLPYETPMSLLRRERLPTSVIIFGGHPESLSLAQLLRQWGVTVHLLTPHSRLLSHEDAAVSDWIAAQLITEGVTLHLDARATEVSQQAGAIAVKLADSHLTAETVVVASNRPYLAGLGLDDWLDLDRPLEVNAFLQTRHPRIYACGAVLGGYEAAAIAREEAHTAVENAIFWNRRRMDYRVLPYALTTRPIFARVGLTAVQAQQRYPESELLIHRQPVSDLPKAQWRESITGFCQVIAHRQGSLLGVHGVGPQADEWVQTAAWLMQQDIPWWTIAQLPASPDSLATLIQHACQQWERDRWRPGQWRRDWADNWCNWRRSR